MSSGGGYSGGTGGYGGGFGQPPQFGGGFGGGFGQPPQFGGGFGGGFGQPPQFGGGFGGGFGQPSQYDGGFGSPYGGFGGGFGQPQQFGGGFGQPQQSPFGGGFGQPQQGSFGNAYAQRFQRPSLGMFPPTSPQPNQPPPGMELNPHYIDRFANGQAGLLDVRPTDNKFRPIQAGGGADRPPPADESTASTMALVPATKDGVSGYYTDGSMRNFVPNTPAGGGYGGGYGNQFGGGFGGGYGGGYSSPYMSPSMMGGLASLFGGMQGGGFQGMLNPGFQQYPSNDQAARQQQMEFDQQRAELMINRPRYQRNPNQPAADQPLAPELIQHIPQIPIEQQVGYTKEFGDFVAKNPRYGTPEHRNSPFILQQIKEIREDKYLSNLNLQSQSDDEIYNSLLQPVYAI